MVVKTALNLIRSENKLCLIELNEADKVRGNYELMISGPVTHIPNHKYLVTEEQIKSLEEKGIKYKKVDL